MAYKCNSCGTTSEEAKDCCGAPMVEEAASTEEAAPEAASEGEASTE